jgi:uncharacterized membrane protein
MTAAFQQDTPVESAFPFGLRKVRPEQPWVWLALGWRDLVSAPWASLAYGGAITAISILIVAMLDGMDRLPLLLPMLAGFALVCPWFAVGLYAISGALAAGQPITVRTIANAVRGNRDQIALMGVLLMLIHIIWIRFATLLFALFFDGFPDGLSGLVDLFLRTPGGFAFLAVGSVIGAGFAALTFAMTVVALPMLIDRDVSVVEAVRTSLAAVAANPVAMALWAAIIAGITLLSFATGFLGLVVTMPLLGYASWHAYRDLLPRPAASLSLFFSSIQRT